MENLSGIVVRFGVSEGAHVATLVVEATVLRDDPLKFRLRELRGCGPVSFNCEYCIGIDLAGMADSVGGTGSIKSLIFGRGSDTERCSLVRNPVPAAKSCLPDAILEVSREGGDCSLKDPEFRFGLDDDPDELAVSCFDAPFSGVDFICRS